MWICPRGLLPENWTVKGESFLAMSRTGTARKDDEEVEIFETADYH